MLHRLNWAMVATATGPSHRIRPIESGRPRDDVPEARVEVDEGMIIGEFNKENDLNVNPTRERKLTNVRASGSDHYVALKGTRDMTLERCMSA